MIKYILGELFVFLKLREILIVSKPNKMFIIQELLYALLYCIDIVFFYRFSKADSLIFSVELLRTVASQATVFCFLLSGIVELETDKN